MATPIGHALAGCAIAFLPERDHSRRHLAEMGAAIALAVAPDLDVLPGLLLDRAILFHRGWSHSLGFAFAAAFLVALVGRLARLEPRRLFFLGLAAYGSHLLLDFFGQDGRAPFGIPLFWPFSSAYVIAPEPFLAGVRHTASLHAGGAELVRGLLVVDNLWAIFLEILVIIPVFAVGLGIRLSRRWLGPADQTAGPAE